MDNLQPKRSPTRNKLLVVDDDETTRLLIKSLMEGYIPVLESDCGNEAYKMFKKSYEEIGLVLLDIRLPGYDGWELVKMLRQLDPWIPILAISASFPAELDRNYESAGFNGYILKPFETNQLKEIILYSCMV